MIDLADLPVVDNHVHPWRAATQQLRADELAGSVCFSETVVTSVRREFLPREELEPSLRLFRATNLGANLLRSELARFLNVNDGDDDWGSVIAARNAAAAADYRAWTGQLFTDA